MGRCVKMDYGHVGCASDVLDLADSRCSGRRQCQIRIPDALFGKTKPCPDDLKPYLEANYECLKGKSVCWNFNEKNPKYSIYCIFMHYLSNLGIYVVWSYPYN